MAVSAISLRSHIFELPCCIQEASGGSSAPFVALFPASTISTSCSGLKQYIILIDAGSSGSRLHVHGYLQSQNELPIIEPSRNKKVKPGLSSFEKNPTAAGQSLIPLLDFAQAEIPTECWDETPLYLQATAGLRSIPLQAAELILESCRQTIARYPFIFKPEWALIISGTQEGVNGWVAVNYLKGIFNQSRSSQQTIGVIEMGGASMQLTFVPQTSQSTCNEQHLVAIQVGDLSYQLYTHSYLDYGLEKIQLLFQRTYMDLIERDGNPCYPVALRHSATGSYDKCATLIASLLDKNVSCSCLPCSFNGIFQPEIKNELFYAIENFFYTGQFFDILELPNFAHQLIQSGTNFCQTHWSDILGKYPKESVMDLEKYCFSSAYIPKVLTHGFGFTEKQNQNVAVVKTIADTSIDWALGAVLLSLLNNGIVDVERTKTSLLTSTLDEATRNWDLFHPFALIIFILGIIVVLTIVLRSVKPTKKNENDPV